MYRIGQRSNNRKTSDRNWTEGIFGIESLIEQQFYTSMIYILVSKIYIRSFSMLYNVLQRLISTAIENT